MANPQKKLHFGISLLGCHFVKPNLYVTDLKLVKLIFQEKNFISNMTDKISKLCSTSVLLTNKKHEDASSKRPIRCAVWIVERMRY